MRRFFNSWMVMLLAGACAAERGTEGAECPNDNNCIAPLRCIQNVCTLVADSGDAGPGDTGPVDTGVVDAGPRDTGVPDTGVPPNYVETIAGGTLNAAPAAAGLGYAALGGRAFMVREETGYTNVLVSANGLTAATEYTAHIHAKACADEVGGGHYKLDPEVAEVIESNELWVTFTTDAEGAGVGTLRLQHYAREDAKAVVIHQPGTGEKIVCGDLSPNADLTANGSFAELPAGSGTGITGTVSLRRYSGGTAVTAEIAGNLVSDATYPTHVHAKRCADEAGGGHYKIDPNNAETVEANEIWPNITTNPAGTSGSGSASSPHIARYDAWSMVVHDPVSGDRLACADLSF